MKRVIPDQSPEGSAVQKLIQNNVMYQCVDKEDAGRRVDNYLISIFKDVPKSHIYQLIRSGQVRVNGGRVKALRRLQTGDRIRIPPISIQTPKLSQYTLTAKEAERLEADIIYEDEHLLVFNKPSGLAVHGGSRCSVGLAEMFKQLRGEEDIPVPAHRLDRQTSGCLIFAKKRTALLALHDVFRRGTIKKVYLALVVGVWDEQHSIVSAPLAIRHGNSRAQVSVSKEGKPSRTHFELIESLGDWSLLRALPHSGRMHQIRVHAAHCGYPIAQDKRYGNFQANRRLEKMGLRRLFLHAERISFSYQGNEISCFAPLPENISSFIEHLRGTMGKTE